MTNKIYTKFQFVGLRGEYQHEVEIKFTSLYRSFSKAPKVIGVALLLAAERSNYWVLAGELQVQFFKLLVQIGFACTNAAGGAGGRAAGLRDTRAWARTRRTAGEFFREAAFERQHVLLR